MFEAKMGNIAHTRIVTIGDDNVVTVAKKNGTVLQKIALSDIAGISFSKPGLTSGAMRFCEDYDDSLASNYMAIMESPTAVLLEKKDLPKAQEILDWYESNKGDAGVSSGYDLEIRSRNSVLALDGNTVILRHSSMIGENLVHRIPIKSINGVHLKKPGTISEGVILFESGVGAGENKKVYFGVEELPLFESFRDRVEELMNAPTTAPAALSEADELQKFAKLHAEGLLTDEEFQAKKKQILGL